MCLNKITGRRTLKKDLIVKKLVVVHQSLGNIYYAGILYNLPREDEKGFYKDPKLNLLYTDKIYKSYRTGFHFHPLSSTNESIANYWNLVSNEKIVRCLIPKGTKIITGIQKDENSSLKVIVARKFKILED